MFTQLGLVYLVVGVIAAVGGGAILRLYTRTDRDPANQRSMTSGYAVISSVLFLWSLGFVCVGTGLGLNTFITVAAN
jgi:hypothetical protein